MGSADIMTALEDAARLIARLDARISVSPLAEVWQVRACFLAAETLASVDGTPTRIADMLGLMSDTPLPHFGNYGPATVGFAHWRRCMARVELSDLASRLVGRTLTAKAKALEAQADLDYEGSLPPATRKPIHSMIEDVDAYAREVSDRALKHMRNLDDTFSGARLLALASGLQSAIRIDPDPDYFERIFDVRRNFEADVRLQAELAKDTLPSPDRALEERIRFEAEEWLSSVTWEKRPHLGACFAIVPDRLRDIGLTSNRLSCLTGATKRLGFEGRLDDRAVRGFLRQLAHEARVGLALLDSLEKLMGTFATSPGSKFNVSSRLPEIIYGLMLYPALDAAWLQTALDLDERVAQKFIKRLSDADLIVHWGDRKSRGEAGREIQLWTAKSFSKDFELAMKRRAVNTSSVKGASVSPAVMLERHRNVNISRPMAAVYEKFDKAMIDIDEQFGHYFRAKPAKNRSPRKIVQSDSKG